MYLGFFFLFFYLLVFSSFLFALSAWPVFAACCLCMHACVCVGGWGAGCGLRDMSHAICDCTIVRARTHISVYRWDIFVVLFVRLFDYLCVCMFHLFWLCYVYCAIIDDHHDDEYER